MAEGVDGLFARGHSPGRQADAADSDDQKGGRDDARRTPGEMTHWTGQANGEGSRGQPSQPAADLGRAWPQAAPSAHLQPVLLNHETAAGWERHVIVRASAFPVGLSLTPGLHHALFLTAASPV